MLGDAEAAVIRRGRLQGDTWQTLATPAGLSPERLRKRWTEETVTRRLEKRRAGRRLTTRMTPPARPPEDDTAMDQRPATVTPIQHLASALSFLQRQTGQTLKDTASDCGISASYISRILSGDRLPSWPVVAQIAHCCDGNLEELRDLWEAAQRPPDLEARARPPAPDQHEAARRCFLTALRALYLAADRPNLWSIRRATGSILSIAAIANALNGADIPDWPSTARLVFALHGRPADFRSLWHAANRPTPPDDCGPRLSAGAFG
ncbi:helix-turn-helix domain-containing protein [Streptomyces lydicus]|uniref:helix-turn-helix domain-containing protein n=1 Tax=Streptomyces lydicus TaxID=47763 RepID=UPI0009A2185C|nr:helix-turn-helix transcriptional regulator [Streptomyces lydicus]